MTEARKLTQDGIREARAYLALLRDDPTMSVGPPDHLLYDPTYAKPFANAPQVRHLPINTRRDAASYLDSFDPPLDRRFVDDWPFWGWLGLFHLADILHSPERRGRMSRETETFVVDPGDKRSLTDNYRHYLWSVWRLDSSLGEEASILMDRDLMRMEDTMRQIVNSPRIFNSMGVPQLILRLYTAEGRNKRGYTRNQGGLRHLLRALPQLERTYDVYGMTPDALLQILPPVFREWDDVEP